MLLLVGSHVGVLKVIADADPDNKRLWGQCTLFLRLPEEVSKERRDGAPHHLSPLGSN